MRLLPPVRQPLAEHIREIAEAINLLIQGRGNYTGTLTLAAGSTSTTLVNSLAHSGSVLTLCPLNANGQGLSWHVSEREQGRIIITHDTPAEDAGFAYAITG